MPIVKILLNLVVAPESPLVSIPMIVRLLLATIILGVSLPAESHAQLYGSADFAVPTRTVSSDNVFARNQTVVTVMGVNTVSVGTASRLALDFDFAAAGRFTVGHQADEFGIEGTYITTDELFATGRVMDAAGTIASPFSQVGAVVSTALDNNMQIDVGYLTELQSLEANLTQLFYSGPNGEATLLYGVRAMSIDERFNYEATNAGGVNTLEVLRDNRLIGPQLGIRAWTPLPDGQLHIHFAGTLAYNDIQGSSVTVGPGFAGGGETIDDSRRQASLIGKLGIEYGLQITPHAALRIGFEVLGLTDVGLAANPPQFTDRFTDDVIYTQPYVGVVLVR